MVDKGLIAAKTAAVARAAARVRAVLPSTVDAFVEDETACEVVILNLFVAIQSCLDLATHWIADAGWPLPRTYGDAFSALVEHGVIPRDLSTRLRAAAAFRNLVAHQYAVVDPRRVHAFATSHLADLEALCAIMGDRASRGA